jgi:hypothetical protein
MPVTPFFKALKTAQEYNKCFAPNLAVMVREGFDFLEQQAAAEKNAFFQYRNVCIPYFVEIAEKFLKAIGEKNLLKQLTQTQRSVLQYFKI